MRNEIAADKIISDLVSIGSGEVTLMKFGKKWVFKMLNTKEHLRTLEESKDLHPTLSGYNELEDIKNVQECNFRFIDRWRN